MEKESGQALVELAVAFSILALLVLGGLDLGRVIYANLHATHGAREGARLAALGYLDHEVVQRVELNVGPLEKLSVAVEPPGGRVRGSSVTVVVHGQQPLLFPWPRPIPNPFPVKASVAMRIE